MYLRSGRYVGKHGLCQCGAYYVNPGLDELCSKCYGAVFYPRGNIAPGVPFSWYTARDHEAPNFFITDDIFRRIADLWVRPRTRALLYAILCEQRENKRWLSYAQMVQLWDIPNRIPDYARVHIFCRFIFDRWNIQTHGKLPGYAACYYGEELQSYPTREKHFEHLKITGIDPRPHLAEE